MKYLLLAALVGLTGCQAAMYGTGADMNAVSIGMPRAEVVQRLGTPLSTSATATSETLHYRKMERVLGWTPTAYFVRLEAGKVTSYGKEEQ